MMTVTGFSFFLMATIFGSLGIFLGLFVFRYKIRKALLR